MATTKTKRVEKKPKLQGPKPKPTGRPSPPQAENFWDYSESYTERDQRNGTLAPRPPKPDNTAAERERIRQAREEAAAEARAQEAAQRRIEQQRQAALDRAEEQARIQAEKAAEGRKALQQQRQQEVNSARQKPVKPLPEGDDPWSQATRAIRGRTEQGPQPRDLLGSIWGGQQEQEEEHPDDWVQFEDGSWGPAYPDVQPNMPGYDSSYVPIQPLQLGNPPLDKGAPPLSATTPTGGTTSQTPSPQDVYPDFNKVTDVTPGKSLNVLNELETLERRLREMPDGLQPLPGGSKEDWLRRIEVWRRRGTTVPQEWRGRVGEVYYGLDNQQQPSIATWADDDGGAPGSGMAMGPSPASATVQVQAPFIVARYLWDQWKNRGVPATWQDINKVAQEPVERPPSGLVTPYPLAQGLSKFVESYTQTSAAALSQKLEEEALSAHSQTRQAMTQAERFAENKAEGDRNPLDAFRAQFPEFYDMVAGGGDVARVILNHVFDKPMRYAATELPWDETGATIGDFVGAASTIAQEVGENYTEERADLPAWLKPVDALGRGGIGLTMAAMGLLGFNPDAGTGQGMQNRVAVMVTARKVIDAMPEGKLKDEAQAAFASNFSGQDNLERMIDGITNREQYAAEYAAAAAALKQQANSFPEGHPQKATLDLRAAEMGAEAAALRNLTANEIIQSNRDIVTELAVGLVLDPTNLLPIGALMDWWRLGKATRAFGSPAAIAAGKYIDEAVAATEEGIRIAGEEGVPLIISKIPNRPVGEAIGDIPIVNVVSLTKGARVNKMVQQSTRLLSHLLSAWPGLTMQDAELITDTLLKNPKQLVVGIPLEQFTTPSIVNSFKDAGVFKVGAEVIGQKTINNFFPALKNAENELLTLVRSSVDDAGLFNKTDFGNGLQDIVQDSGRRLYGVVDLTSATMREVPVGATSFTVRAAKKGESSAQGAAWVIDYYTKDGKLLGTSRAMLDQKNAKSLAEEMGKLANANEHSLPVRILSYPMDLTREIMNLTFLGGTGRNIIKNALNAAVGTTSNGYMSFTTREELFSDIDRLFGPMMGSVRTGEAQAGSLGGAWSEVSKATGKGPRKLIQKISHPLMQVPYSTTRVPVKLGPFKFEIPIGEQNWWTRNYHGALMNNWRGQFKKFISNDVMKPLRDSGVPPEVYAKTNQYLYEYGLTHTRDQFFTELRRVMAGGHTPPSLASIGITEGMLNSRAALLAQDALALYHNPSSTPEQLQQAQQMLRAAFAQQRVQSAEILRNGFPPPGAGIGQRGEIAGDTADYMDALLNTATKAGLSTEGIEAAANLFGKSQDKLFVQFVGEMKIAGVAPDIAHNILAQTSQDLFDAGIVFRQRQWEINAAASEAAKEVKGNRQAVQQVWANANQQLRQSGQELVAKKQEIITQARTYMNNPAQPPPAFNAEAMSERLSNLAGRVTPERKAQLLAGAQPRTFDEQLALGNAETATVDAAYQVAWKAFSEADDQLKAFDDLVAAEEKARWIRSMTHSTVNQMRDKAYAPGAPPGGGKVEKKIAKIWQDAAKAQEKVWLTAAEAMNPGASADMPAMLRGAELPWNEGHTVRYLPESTPGVRAVSGGNFSLTRDALVRIDQVKKSPDFFGFIEQIKIQRDRYAADWKKYSEAAYEMDRDIDRSIAYRIAAGPHKGGHIISPISDGRYFIEFPNSWKTGYVDASELPIVFNKKGQKIPLTTYDEYKAMERKQFELAEMVDEAEFNEQLEITRGNIFERQIDDGYRVEDAIAAANMEIRHNLRLHEIKLEQNRALKAWEEASQLNAARVSELANEIKRLALASLPTEKVQEEMYAVQRALQEAEEDIHNVADAKREAEELAFRNESNQLEKLIRAKYEAEASAQTVGLEPDNAEILRLVPEAGYTGPHTGHMVARSSNPDMDGRSLGQIVESGKPVSILVYQGRQNAGKGEGSFIAGLGQYFSGNVEYAKHYAVGPNSTLKPYVVDLESPKVVDDHNMSNGLTLKGLYGEAEEWVKAQGVDLNEMRGMLGRSSYRGEIMRLYFQDQGYDGLLALDDAIIVKWTSDPKFGISMYQPDSMLPGSADPNMPAMAGMSKTEQLLNEFMTKGASDMKVAPGMEWTDLPPDIKWTDTTRPNPWNIESEIQQLPPFEASNFSNRPELLNAFKDAFQLNDADAATLGALLDARAKVWSYYSGRPADEYFTKAFGNVKRLRGDKAHASIDISDSERGLFGMASKQGEVPQVRVTSYIKEARDLAERGANSNLAVATHELGHMWMRELEAIARHSPAAKKDWQILADWAAKSAKPGKTLGAVGRSGSSPVSGDSFLYNMGEILAEGLNKFLATGKAPTPELQNVFERFAAWAREFVEKAKRYLSVYAKPNAEGIATDLPEDVGGAYANFLRVPDKPLDLGPDWSGDYAANAQIWNQRTMAAHANGGAEDAMQMGNVAGYGLDALDRAETAAIIGMNQARAGALATPANGIPVQAGLGVLNNVGAFNQQWDNMLARAASAADDAAEFTMLEPGNVRNIDTVLRMFMPYHYFWSRSAKNWTQRAIADPRILNAWHAGEQQEEMQQQRNISEYGPGVMPLRAEDRFRIPFTDMYMTNPADILFPFNSYGANEFIDPEVAMNPYERMWLLGKQWTPIGGLPLDVGAAYLMDKMIPRPEGAVPRMQEFGAGDIFPQLNIPALAYQIYTGDIPPIALTGDRFMHGVAGRSVATMGLNSPIVNEVAPNGVDAAEWETLKEWALDAGVMDQQGLKALQEMPQEQAQKIWTEAVKMAGWDKLKQQFWGMLLGPSFVQVHDAELNARAVQSMRRQIGYSEENPTGSQAAVNELDRLSGGIHRALAMYSDMYGREGAAPPDEIDYGRPGFNAVKRDKTAAKDKIYEERNNQVDAIITKNWNLPAKEIDDLTEAAYAAAEAKLDELDSQFPSVQPGRPLTPSFYDDYSPQELQQAAIEQADRAASDAMKQYRKQASALADAEDWDAYYEMKDAEVEYETNLLMKGLADTQKLSEYVLGLPVTPIPTDQLRELAEELAEKGNNLTPTQQKLRDKRLAESEQASEERKVIDAHWDAYNSQPKGKKDDYLRANPDFAAYYLEKYPDNGAWWEDGGSGGSGGSGDGSSTYAGSASDTEIDQWWDEYRALGENFDAKRKYMESHPEFAAYYKGRGFNAWWEEEATGASSDYRSARRNRTDRPGLPGGTGGFGPQFRVPPGGFGGGMGQELPPPTGGAGTGQTNPALDYYAQNRQQVNVQPFQPLGGAAMPQPQPYTMEAPYQIPGRGGEFSELQLPNFPDWDTYTRQLTGNRK